MRIAKRKSSRKNNKTSRNKKTISRCRMILKGILRTSPRMKRKKSQARRSQTKTTQWMMLMTCLITNSGTRTWRT